MIVAMVNGGVLPATDEELMACLGRQDIGAFEALYERYGTLAYSTALRVVGDAHLAEDVTQEVFLRIWRHPDRYVSQRGRFVPWLLSVTRNEAIDQVRSRGRRRRHEFFVEQPERELPADDGHEPDLMAELADERRRIRGALANLPMEQRRTIEMAYFGGYTQQEIAALLGEPLGTVKTRIRLGMRKLRALLTPDMQMAGLQSA